MNIEGHLSNQEDWEDLLLMTIFNCQILALERQNVLTGEVYQVQKLLLG